MRPSPPAGLLALVGALALSAACSTSPASTDASADSSQPLPVVDTRLAIAGATNANASVAARGAEIVVVWAATTGDITNVHAAVSHDAGATFGAPVRVNDIDGDARVNGEQAPRVVLGRDIDVAWTSKLGGQSRVRLSRSVDGGQTFVPAVTLHDLQLTGARGWVSIATDDAGVVHAVWLDGRSAAQAPAPKAGATHDMHASTEQDVYETTWRSTGTRVEARVATNVCFCCKTSVAISARGSVFAAFRNIYPTNLRDMAVARSDDGAHSFSAPVRVSEDHWQLDACPEDGPSMTVTADNVLHIVWPTLVEDTNPRKAIFYSYSTDNGQTFAPRRQIDDGASTHGAAHPQITSRANEVAVVWEESAEAGHVVRMRDVTREPGSNGVGLGPIATATLGGSAVYPSVAGTNDALIVAWTSTKDGASTIVVRRLPR